MTGGYGHPEAYCIASQKFLNTWNRLFNYSLDIIIGTDNEKKPSR